MTVYLSPASRCFFTVRFLIVGCIAVSIPNFPSDDMDPIISVAYEDDLKHSCFLFTSELLYQTCLLGANEVFRTTKLPMPSRHQAD